MAIVTAENLTKHYGAGTNLTKALDGVSLTIAEGEFAAIAGASGSGKSTLLHLLGGLDRPTSGRVQIRGKDLYAMKEEELTVFRRREIGFVFQNYNLVPVLNVLENIVLPAELDGKDPDKTYIAQIVDALGLTEKLSNMPNTLSGGQQQRVAVARALASKPALILADEPHRQSGYPGGRRSFGYSQSPQRPRAYGDPHHPRSGHSRLRRADGAHPRRPDTGGQPARGGISAESGILTCPAVPMEPPGLFFPPPFTKPLYSQIS